MPINLDFMPHLFIIECGLPNREGESKTLFLLLVFEMVVLGLLLLEKQGEFGVEALEPQEIGDTLELLVFRRSILLIGGSTIGRCK